MRFQLEPVACRLDEHGRELPDENDDWLLQHVSSSDVVSLRNLRTDHVAELGKDHIYDFRSNPSRSAEEIKYGFLVLKMQIFVQGNRLWYRPNARLGESVGRLHSPRTQPSRAIIALLEDLAKARIWSGKPADYNKYATRVLYGEEFGNLLNEPADYFSALLVHDYIQIFGLTDNGNRPDGTPDTTVTIQVAPRGHVELEQAQSNPRFHTDARTNGARR
ncbi:MAG: hypothetical protein ACRD3C_12615 [Vicinamibacterales bacterium]